ncbi:MAG: VWA domain-containing protein [Lachnospiraceae bacterium]|nr:VWA domain-containing protein [Lachnospiraceae bacterium]
MELKYGFVFLIGIVVLVLLFFLQFKGKDKYKGGKKVVGLSYMEEDPYYKKKVLQYKILSYVLLLSFVVGILASFWLLARPYKVVVNEKENYNRDIILCIDVSTSVDELNLKLVEELKNTVKNLRGERFGIVIFNASAVMLSPLTDDYEFTIDVLDQLKKSLETYNGDKVPDDYFYRVDYIMSGTTLGAEERGSSLIGDGLATSVYDFPNLEEERTRIVILSTDNELEGTPIVTLEEAVSICKENNVVVYGIGTKEMSDIEMEEMKTAVEKTGGRFFLEEESGTMHEIVSEIEKAGKNLIKGSKEMKMVEQVEVPVVFLITSVFFVILVTKITKG